MKQQKTADRAEPVTGDPSLELVPLIYRSNGETGDGQDECRECHQERDEPHTRAECAVTKKRLDEDAARMVADYLREIGEQP